MFITFVAYMPAGMADLLQETTNSNGRLIWKEAL